MLAALGIVEPPMLELVTAKFIKGREPWAAQRLPLVEARIHTRLRELFHRPGDADWLNGAFNAGDLIMVHMLHG